VSRLTRFRARTRCGYSAERTRRELAWLHTQPGVARLPCVRNGRMHVADGVKLFSRPGPSLVDSLERLAEMLA
jgi:iron complex transport system substrate-binding protein